MKPVAEFVPDQARKIRFLLTDIDDTLTVDGKLPAEAYAALWKLQEMGIKVVPVTGRPAGWCDMVIRQWPVDAVIGENGALVFYWRENFFPEATLDGKARGPAGSVGNISAGSEGKSPYQIFYHPAVADSDIRRKLDLVRDTVLNEVPGSRVARDQFCRLFDLAIDFNEDEPKLGYEAAERIKGICNRLGAIAKISSIHVNVWYGEYDKLSAALRFFSGVLGFDEIEFRETSVFFGDSPNDEPMFKYFPLSVGVANIRETEGLMSSKPAFITKNRGGYGFSEAVNLIETWRKGCRHGLDG